MMIMGGRVESGPESNSYDLLASVTRSLLPLLERNGIATAEEVAIDTLADRLRQEATANECVTFFPSLMALGYGCRNLNRRFWLRDANNTGCRGSQRRDRLGSGALFFRSPRYVRFSR